MAARVTSRAFTFNPAAAVQSSPFGVSPVEQARERGADVEDARTYGAVSSAVKVVSRSWRRGARRSVTPATP